MKKIMSESDSVSIQDHLVVKNKLPGWRSKIREEEKQITESRKKNKALLYH
jgi:hypothetical protein